MKHSKTVLHWLLFLVFISITASLSYTSATKFGVEAWRNGIFTTDYRGDFFGILVCIIFASFSYATYPLHKARNTHKENS